MVLGLHCDSQRTEHFPEHVGGHREGGCGAEGGLCGHPAWLNTVQIPGGVVVGSLRIAFFTSLERDVFLPLFWIAVLYIFPHN